MRRLLPPATALLVSLLLVLFAPASPAFAAWTWPLQGELITGYRNGDDPYAAGQHRGIDIAGAVGAPVVAAAAGEVRFAGTAGSSGLTVSVRTDDGFDTSYLHLSAAQVRAGERVSAGQRLGAVGISGVRSAAAPHLHFGVREAGSRHDYRDPLAFLPPPPVPAPEAPTAAPLPEPVPAAPLLAPEPPGARDPARRPAPGARRIPSTRRIPVRRPVPGRRRAPLPGRAPEGQRIPQPSPAPRSAPQPAAPRSRSPQPRDAPAGRSAPASAADHSFARPVLGQAPRAEPSAVSDLEGVPGAPPAQPAVRSSGPDLGLALACLGVLLAAAILAFSGEGGRSGRRGGARLAAAIRPLLGRR